MSPQPDAPVQLLYRFSNAVDTCDLEGVVACFTPDGIFQRGAEKIAGKNDILSLYRARLADTRRRTSHLWSNVAEISRTYDLAVIEAVLTNYAIEPQVSETEVQMRVGRVRGVLKRDPDGLWQFAEHLYENTFAARLPLNT